MEFAFAALLLITMSFALVDFGRLIYDMQVITNLTREGSILTARGTSLTDAANAVMTESSPLNFNTNGAVIITQVTNIAGAYVIGGQVSQGGITATSQVGSLATGVATLPTAVQPQLNQSVFVTEVYYSFAPITPVGSLLGLTLPSRLYDVAYF